MSRARSQPPGSGLLPGKALRAIAAVLVCALVLAGGGLGPADRAQAPLVDYDTDADGLIDVATVAQLNAMRWDLNEDGAPDSSADQTDYEAAFPNAMTSPRMGCDPRCSGYELTRNLSLSGAGDSSLGWDPIGSSNNTFNTTFDGGTVFSISNLFINRSGTSRIGLFGEAGTQSVLRNIRLVGVNVRGGANTGALAGWNGGSISNARAAGTA